MSRIARGALALGLAAVACGRSGIDQPLDPTGIAGAAEPGAGAASGAGGEVGGPSGVGGAAVTTPVLCAEASTSCGAGSCVNGVCVDGINFVFITSETFVGGSLGGLDGADAICQRLAAVAKLPGRYLAWLADSSGSPATRFIKSGRPYELVDGSLIANNWIDLTSGELHHPISLTESGGTPQKTRFCDVTAAYVWTGTAASGNPFNQVNPEGSCGNWSDIASGSFQVGRGDVMDSTWSYACAGLGDPTPDCASAAALYCFQQ